MGSIDGAVLLNALYKLRLDDYFLVVPKNLLKGKFHKDGLGYKKVGVF